MSEVIRTLRTAALRLEDTGRTDGQLLGDFVERRDESAFEALVHRHGPMVWGVCRRALRDSQDAEDAFQATFLVLVKKAPSILPREKVPHWLYGVARQTAMKARATATRRLARERTGTETPEPAAPDSSPQAGNELGELLDQELGRLPERYRLPLLLCDLEGTPRKEAARRLGWREGTLDGRLARARKVLEGRLSRRGLALSAGAVAGVLSASVASASVPTSLLETTAQAASLSTTGQLVGKGISPGAVALAEGVLRTMTWTKAKLAAAVALVLGLVFTGAGVSAQILRGEAQNPTPGTTSAREAAQAEKPSDPPTGSKADKEDKVRTLLKERLAVLKEMAAQVHERFKAGASSSAEVMRANQEVYKAELELCETPKERVAVLEKNLDATKVLEDHVAQLVKAGAVPTAELLRAKANRLEAEIALEREKAKLPPK